MIPASFEYFTPTTLPEAISLLTKYGDEAKILAGGHSLIPMMKLRLATPAYLIDINKISDLEYVKEEGGYLKIGALTREVTLEESDLVAKKFPILLDTTKVIADPLVRNLATVGGNLAHGDPANDHPATMIALGAQVVATGPKGTRTIPITEFFVDLMTTALQPDEILTEIQIPVPPKNSGGAYFKVERKVGDFAIAGVGVQLTLEKNDVCKAIGIGLTNVGSTPIKAEKAEQYLLGKKLEEAAIKEAARLASEEADPTSDLRGDEEFKRSLVKVLTVRAINKALARAKGGK
ncbi:MAG: xanthine dehydrogenase family protein subunit M [Calditrichaeota bacterium]|nr:MAG: xanthine dehydrogenase family protein subunit M [Calditrichota bacterium]